MIKAIKFELYKLIKEPFLWITLGIILIVNFIMTAGTKVTIDGLFQKSFITSVIASLYVAFQVGNDFESRRFLYVILSGISRLKIVISKLVSSILAAEILTLTFPCIEILKNPGWDLELKGLIIICYTLLGLFLGVLGMSAAWFFRNAGIAIVVVIIYHLSSLFFLNSAILSNMAMNFFPMGILKQLIDGTAQLYLGFILGGWIFILIISMLAISKYCDW